MAYGDENLNLRNFEKHTPEDVFEEVTGITMNQFLFLRDGGEYVEEKDEDIFDYIPNQKTNQIFTPKWIGKMMV